MWQLWAGHRICGWREDLRNGAWGLALKAQDRGPAAAGKAPPESPRRLSVPQLCPAPSCSGGRACRGAKGPWGTPQPTLSSPHLQSLSFLLCKMGFRS